jgi:hypothetical protein
MRDWDWGAIWRNFRLVRLGLILLTGLCGVWFKHVKSDSPDPRAAAVMLQACSEAVGFQVTPDYQIQRVPRGETAVAVRPDGARMPARTALVGNLARHFSADAVAAGVEESGQAEGVRQAMDALREGYGNDLAPEDQLAVVPSGWQIAFTR